MNTYMRGCVCLTSGNHHHPTCTKGTPSMRAHKTLVKYSVLVQQLMACCACIHPHFVCIVSNVYTATYLHMSESLQVLIFAVVIPPLQHACICMYVCMYVCMAVSAVVVPPLQYACICMYV
jgi:hypothetical protein